MDFANFSYKQIVHFSHKHPLSFEPEQRIDGVEVSCYGCQESIWGPSYGCILCRFYLHKLCAELPGEMKQHPLHPQHPLTRLPKPSFSSICCCAACGRPCESFLYSCSSCSFYLDITCLSMTNEIRQKIKHASHDHPLISLQKPALFFCSACGTEHRGASYLCTTCGYWVNQKCASLPTTIKCSDHNHPLTLTYSFPDEYYQFRPNCDICTQKLNRPYWVYYCVGCRYFSHVNCATSKAEVSRDCETEVEGEEDLDSNLISLPIADDSVDLITLFIKGISLQGKYKKAAEINHFSHEHPLIFVDEDETKHESSSDNKLPLSDSKYDENCNGCAKPIISAPFYKCGKCNFLLHECCVELQNELLHHPSHPEHPLLLIAQQTTNFRLRWCQCCTKDCNVFMYGCSACKFYLDIDCASLPHKVRHEVHKRTLYLKHISSGRCSTCDGIVSGFVFSCNTCNFNLCYLCALLPPKFWHRWDKHPFLLTYSPVENHLDEYYCEICEHEINPKRWFYHCVLCDQSLHTGCVHPRLVDMYSNVKFGCTLEVNDHPHPLTYIRRPKKNRPGPPCDRCGKHSDHNTTILECSPCNFRLHYNCVSNLNDEEHQL